MKAKITLLILRVVAVVYPLETWGATLDQEYIASTGNGLVVSKVQTVAQTFQVGMSGFLDRVELGLARNGAVLPAKGLAFEIRSTLANGDPGNNVLASIAIAAADISTSYQFNLYLRPFDLAVTTGDTLALVLSTEAEVQPVGIYPFAWSGDAPGNYGSGTIYVDHGNGFLPTAWDAAFQTYVDTAVVPEPSVLGLSLLAGGVLFCRRLAEK